MPAHYGFLLAFSAAISHSCIDTLRKAGTRLCGTQLVCLVAILEGSASMAFVLGQGTLTAPDVRISQTFLFAASMSAALRILSLLLYQAAIALSPLSVTIPYLSFTPAMLVITAYLLIGERPSPNGLVGVCVVTLGGYLLARSNAHNVAAAKKADADVAGERKDAAATMELGFDVLLTDSTAGAAPVKPRLTGALESALRSVQKLGESKGSVLMVAVAALWSLTSTFDKLGMASAPTLAAYLAVQRLITALPCAAYLLLRDPTAFRLVYEEWSLLGGLCCAELLTVLLYLWSLKYLFVSYAVAAKRSGILLSCMCGWLFFGETIRDKLAYICIMMLGMLLIVLAPEHGYNKHLRHP